jgi:hypothetical protein
VTALGAAALLTHATLLAAQDRASDAREPLPYAVPWTRVSSSEVFTVRLYRPSQLILINTALGALSGAVAARLTHQSVSQGALRGARAGAFIGSGEYFLSRRLENALLAKTLVTIGASEIRGIIEKTPPFSEFRTDVGPVVLTYRRGEGVHPSLALDQTIDLITTIARGDTFLLHESLLSGTPVFETSFSDARVLGRTWANVIRVRRRDNSQPLVFYAERRSGFETLYSYANTHAARRIVVGHEMFHVLHGQTLNALAPLFTYERVDNLFKTIPILSHVEKTLDTFESLGVNVDGIRVFPILLIESFVPYRDRFSELKARTSGTIPARLYATRPTPIP